MALSTVLRRVKIETRIRDEFFKTRCAILSLFLSLFSRNETSFSTRRRDDRDVVKAWQSLN